MRKATRAITNASRKAKCALTLIELLVVLVILTTVSVVVLEGAAGKIDEASYDKTVASLQAVSDAIVGNPLMTGDEPIVSYVADCGSLPKAVGGNPALYLDGLVNLPAGMQAYALRYGDGGNGTGLDGDIQLYTGWRGPYISLPLNTTELLDGWNNVFNYTLMPGTNEILSIQSNGGLESPYNISIPSSPIVFGIDDSPNGIDSPYFVTVTGSVNYNLSTGGDLNVKIFYPDPSDGDIAITSFPSAPPTVSGPGVFTFSFDDIPIGYHPIRVRIDIPPAGESADIFETEWVTVPQGGLSGVQLYIDN